MTARRRDVVTLLPALILGGMITFGVYGFPIGSAA